MGRHKQSCQALAAGRRLSRGSAAGAELGSLRVHKKDRSYKRREIKKLLPPPRLGSLANSFLTPWLAEALATH